MDAKLFLSFRPAEEAKHLEVCHMLAERLGGYEPDPGEAGLARASNHPFAQAALDPDVPVEAYVAALGALDDQLDLNLHLSHLQHARDEIVRNGAPAHRRRSRRATWPSPGRSSAVASPRWTPVGRAAVIDAVHDFLANVILAGYRNTWLLPEKSREPWLAAEEETARHGLGASTLAQERSVLRATIAQVRERLRQLGPRLCPASNHPELGTIQDLGTLRRQGDSRC